MDVIDKIINNKETSLSAKIIRLWAVSMINYRTNLGDKSWKEMGKLTCDEITMALSFISGFSTGLGMDCEDRFKKLKDLVPELNE